MTAIPTSRRDPIPRIVEPGDGGLTGQDRFPIDEERAGSATVFATAELGAGELKFFAQDVEERSLRMGGDGPWLAVDPESNGDRTVVLRLRHCGIGSGANSELQGVGCERRNTSDQERVDQVVTLQSRIGWVCTHAYEPGDRRDRRRFGCGCTRRSRAKCWCPPGQRKPPPEPRERTLIWSEDVCRG
jgi:hypothetical protein